MVVDTICRYIYMFCIVATFQNIIYLLYKTFDVKVGVIF